MEGEAPTEAWPVAWRGGRVKAGRAWEADGPHGCVRGQLLVGGAEGGHQPRPEQATGKGQESQEWQWVQGPPRSGGFSGPPTQGPVTR